MDVCMLDYSSCICVVKFPDSSPISSSFDNLGDRSYSIIVSSVELGY